MVNHDLEREVLMSLTLADNDECNGLQWQIQIMICDVYARTGHARLFEVCADSSERCDSAALKYKQVDHC